ncbi:MAG: DUF3473 domain-containing protein [Gammaproteobacteria bacterium]|nr:DUF3473 domain-containing protein [Gammaproteobacteria bacterium]
MESSFKNALTVDVEDYFQVSAFEKYIPRSSWNDISCRVEHNTYRILELFEENDARATFFMLGWVAERYPELIREIYSAGHEVASHGYEHVRVIYQKPHEFREDVVRTKNILEDILGVQVRGYRAASYSIGKDNLWAIEELKLAGYEYSSSIYPIKHDLYGMPEAPRFPFYPLGERGVLEIPVTTIEIMGKKFPCGGGGFFRLYPYAISRWAIHQVNHKDKQPSVFYFHPWEIDPAQPRQKGLDFRTRFRHYLNLEHMEARLSRLLSDFGWDRMDKVFIDNKHVSTR